MVVGRNDCAKGRQMKDTVIGVDLAKNIFQVHGASRAGEVMFRKKLRRQQFMQFMATQPPALVVLEACGSAHYWARELAGAGHEVRLIAPQYVKPFVKRQKNDAADAEAIVIAARQPEMRFVEPRTEAQQARGVLFRARQRLVHQRTELVNALRAVLYEFGLVVPQGIAHIRHIEAMLDEAVLPEAVKQECLDLLRQISEQSVRIDVRTKKIRMLAQESENTCRLQSMPGVGPLTALAIEAFAPDL
ncbi:transposase, partial [Acetobacter pasteurianus]